MSKETVLKEKPKKKKSTKLYSILSKRQLSQGDLIRLIEATSGKKIGRDRVSKICTGKMKNYHLSTAALIADALGVTIDDICEMDALRKGNAS